MKKFKLFSSYSAEEKWLNEQSNLGWKLVKKKLFYTFHKNTQNSSVYAVDYRIFKNKDSYQDYLNLFQDSGWIHVAGSRLSGEQYFISLLNEDKDVSIFSDRESSQYRYKKKMINSIQGIGYLLTYLVVAILYGYFDIRMIMEPRYAFLTPGLWEKSGMEFWKAYLFELPFALIFRILPVILIIGYIILMVTYLLWAFYSQNKERKFENEN
ncbi:DUF2812 domain-containing protein [Tissierella pigra]|uniref:DUF2812 domain-containing protein n=1 Tax=Tissierella pigra TaxID=2607614 RepID=A0A6N7XGV0_9FIRM|nr:DUF2812 domain-containing protein [Tissierella pigra]MBU5426276.1 DUF2812 domain-containing protein [Tissierella pigra]MSU01259.1 DUF2812 domain-containing protein [Tissierella pigra]